MKKWVVVASSLVVVMLMIGGFVSYVPENVENDSIQGVQIRSQVWRGHIEIGEDTYFAPWAQITIMPGTVITFEKKPDREDGAWSTWADDFIKEHNDTTGKEGYKKTHFSLYGKIIAKGNGNPILFTSAQKNKEYADWDELVLRSGSVLDTVIVEYAHNGINVDGANVIIRKSKVHDSLWSCIDIFSQGNRIQENEIYHCWHQGIGVKARGENRIENNYVHDAQLSVNCEFGANPTIKNNTFEAAPLGEDCTASASADNNLQEREPDVVGGTYNNKVVYPSK